MSRDQSGQKKKKKLKCAYHTKNGGTPLLAHSILRSFSHLYSGVILGTTAAVAHPFLQCY